MHEFKDSSGRLWPLSIDCATVEAVKAECGANILDLADPQSDLTQQVAAFPPLVCKLLYSAVKDLAVERRVDARDFARAMNGDALSDATDALLEELVLFCPRHRREVLAEVLRKNREVQTASTDLVLARLREPELVSQALAAMDRRVRLQIEEALRELDPQPTAAASASESSPSAGPPPACCASPGPDLTPGASSSGSPTGPGGPIAG